MNKADETTYVGITKHPRLRAMQHALSHPIARPKDGSALLNRNSPLGEYEARGVEQHLIKHPRMSYRPKVTQAEYNSFKLENGLLENKINSLSKNHRFYKEGTEFGKEWIENNHPNIQ